MKRIFVELPPFRRYIDDLLNGPSILKEIQDTLLEQPELGDLIVGTGGLRKMRQAGKGKGKRGGYRVTYLYNPSREKIYLFVIYAKNEQDSLSASEKKELKQFVERLKGEVR